jgi:hypothetical protein
LLDDAEILTRFFRDLDALADKSFGIQQLPQNLARCAAREINGSAVRAQPLQDTRDVDPAAAGIPPRGTASELARVDKAFDRRCDIDGGVQRDR